MKLSPLLVAVLASLILIEASSAVNKQNKKKKVSSETVQSIRALTNPGDCRGYVGLWEALDIYVANTDDDPVGDASTLKVSIKCDESESVMRTRIHNLELSEFLQLCALSPTLLSLYYLYLYLFT